MVEEIEFWNGSKECKSVCRVSWMLPWRQHFRLHWLQLCPVSRNCVPSPRYVARGTGGWGCRGRGPGATPGRSGQSWGPPPRPCPGPSPAATGSRRGGWAILYCIVLYYIVSTWARRPPSASSSWAASWDRAGGGAATCTAATAASSGRSGAPADIFTLSSLDIFPQLWPSPACGVYPACGGGSWGSWWWWRRCWPPWTWCSWSMFRWGGCRWWWGWSPTPCSGISSETAGSSLLDSDKWYVFQLSNSIMTKYISVCYSLCHQTF